MTAEQVTVQTSELFIGGREVARRMLAYEAGAGKVIVTIASAPAFWVNGQAAHYAAARHRTVDVTNALATELDSSTVHVVGIAPAGKQKPDLSVSNQAVATAKPRLETFSKSPPMSRHGLPDDSTRVVLFSGSAIAAFVTIIINSNCRLGSGLV